MSAAGDDNDHHWLREALAEAALARHATSPNPMVGAILVDAEGREVARARHTRAGEPHAERLALEAAGERAAGATLYVTLEPCAHTGRTPPCVDAIITAKVARVVVAMEDPDPRVAGAGLEKLKAAGIAVSLATADIAAAARKLNRFYIKHRSTGLPYVTAKWAMTLDGRIATATGDSHWITGEESRAAAHLLRHEHDAILVGVGTVLADDPELTARGNSWYRQPLRVVADTRTSTPATAKLAGPNTLIATTMPDSPQAAALRDRGAEVVGVEGTDAGINLGALLRHLAERGILSVLVEGGAGIHGALFDARLVDAVVAFVAPKIVGGVGPAPVKGEGVDELADALNLEAIEVRRLGADIMISGECSRG